MAYSGHNLYVAPGTGRPAMVAVPHVEVNINSGGNVLPPPPPPDTDAVRPSTDRWLCCDCRLWLLAVMLSAIVTVALLLLHIYLFGVTVDTQWPTDPSTNHYPYRTTPVTLTPTTVNITMYYTIENSSTFSPSPVGVHKQ